MLGDTELAGKLLDESYEIAKPLPLSILHSFIRFWRGWAAIVRGELQLAREMFEDGVRFGRQISHRTSFAHSCAMLGKVLCKLGEYDEAYARLSDGLRVHLEIGDGWGLALDLEGLAGLVIARERYADGVRLMGAVDALRERVAIALAGVGPRRARATRRRSRASSWAATTSGCTTKGARCRWRTSRRSRARRAGCRPRSIRCRCSDDASGDAAGGSGRG